MMLFSLQLISDCVLGGTKNTNFQNSMGALSNPISFAIRISKHFVFVLAQLEGPPQNFGESVPKPPLRPFGQNSFIFIIAGLEPKIFVFKSSSKQQSCKPHTIGQICHQDQSYMCLCSNVTDQAIIAFQLAPK